MALANLPKADACTTVMECFDKAYWYERYEQWNGLPQEMTRREGQTLQNFLGEPAKLQARFYDAYWPLTGEVIVAIPKLFRL